MGVSVIQTVFTRWSSILPPSSVCWLFHAFLKLLGILLVRMGWRTLMPTEQLGAPAIRTCQSQAGPYLLTDTDLPAALPLIIIFNSVLGLVYSPWLNQGCTIAVLLSAVNKGAYATGPSKGMEAVEILFGGLLEP